MLPSRGGAPGPGVCGGGQSWPRAGAPSPSPGTGELPAPARASRGEGIKRSSALPLKRFCFFFPQKGFIGGRPGIGAEQGGGLGLGLEAARISGGLRAPGVPQLPLLSLLGTQRGW